MRRTATQPVYPLTPELAHDIVRESLMADAHLTRHAKVPYGRVYRKVGVEIGAERDFVCAIGVFDGLHLGHRELIDAAAADAAKRGVPLAVVTFDPDPSEVVPNHRVDRLLSDRDRIRSMGLTPADAIISLSFTEDLRRHDYERFVREVLSSLVHPVSIHVGADFAFGYDAGRRGTPADLAELGRELGFAAHGHDLEHDGDDVVSSTLVRNLLAAGDLDSVRRLVCRSPYVRVRMVALEDDGGGVGEFDPRDCQPATGRYAAYVVSGTRAYPAMVLVARRGQHKNPVIVPIAGTDLRPGSDCRIVLLRRISAARQDAEGEPVMRIVECVRWVQDNLGTAVVEVGR